MWEMLAVLFEIGIWFLVLAGMAWLVCAVLAVINDWLWLRRGVETVRLKRRRALRARG